MFWASKTPPARVPSDEVVDLPYFDDTFFLQTFVLHSMLVFDHALDAHKLHDALERLARRDGWRKLAARLRKKDSGGVEYHIPTEFSEGRPAISYTHVEYATTIGEHPLASRLPRPTATPAIVAVAEDFKPLYFGPGSPDNFNDYVYQDRSILGLRTVSFSDATVVVLHWLHVAFDAMAKKAILEAWLLVLQGRDDDVATPVSYREDPLRDLGRNPTEPHVLAARKLGKLGMVRWVFNNVLDLFWRAQETRMFCLPAGFIEGLRATAMEELAAGAPGGDAAADESWVSEGDVLVAWLARIGSCHFPPDVDKTIVLSGPFCCRKTLKGSLLPADKPFISNAVSFFNVLMPLQDLVANRVSYTAQAMRRVLRQQTTREQIEAQCALLRENEPKKLPPFFGDSSLHSIHYSNWSKAEFFHFDFSAASVSGATGKVTPRYIQNTQGPMKFSGMFLIVGKDRLGNYWVTSSTTVQRWAAVDEAMARGDFFGKGP